jgi:hypothetical protein
VRLPNDPISVLSGIKPLMSHPWMSFLLLPPDSRVANLTSLCKFQSCEEPRERGGDRFLVVHIARRETFGLDEALPYMH